MFSGTYLRFFDLIEKNIVQNQKMQELLSPDKQKEPDVDDEVSSDGGDFEFNIDVIEVDDNLHLKQNQEPLD